MRTKTRRKLHTIKIRHVQLKDDFYSCINKKWINHSIIPKDEIIVDNFNNLTNKIESQLKQIIKNARGRESENIKNIYNSSINWNNKGVELTVFRLLNEMKTIILEKDIYKFLSFLTMNGINHLFKINIEQSIYEHGKKIVTIDATPQSFINVHYYHHTHT
jgi:predicted metalloendopeptidase